MRFSATLHCPYRGLRLRMPRACRRYGLWAFKGQGAACPALAYRFARGAIGTERFEKVDFSAQAVAGIRRHGRDDAQHGHGVGLAGLGFDLVAAHAQKASSEHEAERCAMG